jgi:hypothetical protein
LKRRVIIQIFFLFISFSLSAVWFVEGQKMEALTCSMRGEKGRQVKHESTVKKKKKKVFFQKDKRRDSSLSAFG